VLIANDNCGHAWQPQWRMSDVPTKLDDEFGDRHIKCLTPDRDQDTSAFTDQRCDRACRSGKNAEKTPAIEDAWLPDLAIRAAPFH
jgi:hypothetical protein